MSRNQRKTETLRKLVFQFAKDPSNVGDTAQFLTVSDLARFFKQLTDPDPDIRISSLEIVLYLICGSYQRKYELMSGLHLEQGPCVFNPLNPDRLKNHHQESNTILEKVEMWMQKQEQQNTRKREAIQSKGEKNLFQNVGVYDYSSGSIISWNSLQKKADPLEYLVFGILQSNSFCQRITKQKIDIQQSFNGNESITFGRNFGRISQQKVVQNQKHKQKDNQR